MDAIAIIAGIGILYLLTRDGQTPPTAGAVNTNMPSLPGNPTAIAIGEPNASMIGPSGGGEGGIRIGGGIEWPRQAPLWFGSGDAYATNGGNGQSYSEQYPYAPGVIRVPPEND